MASNGNGHPRSYLRRPTLGAYRKHFNYASLDPVEYFILRYIVRAIVDYLWPSLSLSHQDYLSARDLVLSPDGQMMISYFGISIEKINQTLRTVNEN